MRRINRGVLDPDVQFPFWSGVPVQITNNLLVVLLHVSDPRQVDAPEGWTHTDFMETESGSVEVHLYRRTD